MTDASEIVEQLDLSNLIKHAFMAGWESAKNGRPKATAWVSYDPSQCQAFERILSALSPDFLARVERMEKVVRRLAEIEDLIDKPEPTDVVIVSHDLVLAARAAISPTTEEAGGMN